MKQGENPADPSEASTGAVGITITNDEYMQFDTAQNKIPKVFTWVDYSDFEHLLRNDLNSAEKMCLEWAIANTVNIPSKMSGPADGNRLRMKSCTPYIIYSQTSRKSMGCLTIISTQRRYLKSDSATNKLYVYTFLVWIIYD